MRPPPGGSALIGYVVGLQLRRDTTALLAGVNRRVATGENDDEAGRERESLERFAAALPQPRRIVAAVMVIVVLLLAQNLVDPLANLTSNLSAEWVFPGETSMKLTDALNAFGGTLDVHSVVDVLSAFRGADLPQLINLIAAITISLFVVCRAYTAAYTRANLILARPWGLEGSGGKTLRQEAADIAVDAKQGVLFDALDILRPRDFPLDLALKAIICAAPVLLWVYLVRELILLVPDQSFSVVRSVAIPVSYLGVLIGLRLRWVFRQWRRRRSGVSPLLIGIAACLAAGIWVPMRTSFTAEGPTPASDPLRATLSAQQQLANVDLRGRDLQGFHLVDKDMRGAQLQNANLDGANLSGSDLEQANLTLAELSGTDLTRAELRDGDLTDAQAPNINLSRATLASASLVNTGLTDANLSAADLRGARVSGFLLGVSARRADFTGGDLRTAYFGSADLEGALFNGADLRGANFDDADLTDAALQGAHMGGASLSDAKFTGADLAHADLSGIQTFQVSFAGADLAGAKIDDTESGTIDATGADLRNAYIRVAKWHGQQLGSLEVAGADLRGATIVGGVGLVGDSRTKWPTGYAVSGSGSNVYAYPATP